MSPSVLPVVARETTRFKRVAYRFRVEGWTCDATSEERTVYSLFDSEDIAEYQRLGFVLVEGVLDSARVDEIRVALERLRQEDFGELRDSANPVESHFQGQYVQGALLRDPAISRLLEPEPIVDTVRSLLGPCVALYGSSGLVAFPEAARTGTDWHADYLVTVSPPPPLVTRIPRVACMLYLDDLDHDLGPTYVAPGSHHWQAIPEWKPSVEPLHEALTPRAGSVLFFDASLWHRGGAMLGANRPRRALVFQFVAGGIRLMRETPPLPKEGTHARELIERAQATGDRGMQELLSQVWYG